MSPAGRIAFTYGLSSSRGQRPRQEDFCAIWQADNPDRAGLSPPILVVLSDGMGGHASGHLASKLACMRYVEVFELAPGGVGAKMMQALEDSNEAIRLEVSQKPDLKGMGCTIVGAYLDQSGLRWVSVGDSALMLYRGGALYKLNADHSHGALLDRQAAQGLISKEAAAGDNHRRALHSALTGEQIPMRELEFTGHRLLPGDFVVVASDGLLTLEGNEIAAALHAHRERPASDIARRLLAEVEARKKPGQDNTTIVVVKVAAGPDHGRVSAEMDSERTQPLPPDAPETHEKRLADIVAVAEDRDEDDVATEVGAMTSRRGDDG